MHNLYTSTFLQASSRNHNILPSPETQQKHLAALKDAKIEDVKIYKKENKRDHSLLILSNAPVIVGKRLGQGGFGVVKKAVMAPEGKLLALKRVLFDSSTKREGELIRQDFWAEIEALQIMGQYRGHGVRMSRVGEKGYILTELHHGRDLSSYTDVNSFTFEQSLKIILGMLAQLRLLHDHTPAYLHNDLKPENIKIDLTDAHAPIVKLMDFGATRQVGEMVSTCTYGYTDPCMGYATAPRTFAIEMYSVGKVAEHILQCTDHANYTASYKQLSSMMESCCDPNHLKRPGISELEGTIQRLISGMTSNQRSRTCVLI